MGKIWFFVLVFLSFSFGRENPFVPTGELNTSVTTTNSVEILTPFEKQNIKFPSDARNFISISVKYKSEDGSIKEKVIDVNKSINWNDELTLTKTLSPAVVLKPDVSVTNELDNKVILKKEVKPDEVFDFNTTIVGNISKDKLMDIVIDPAPVKPEIQEPLKVVKFDRADLEIYPMKIKVITKDIKIKDFMILRDNKIVIDLKSSKPFYTKIAEINCGAFNNVKFGAHNDFYRIVITLDGRYKYAIDASEEGYLLKVKK
ncbi:AMIN domain-containing protein [Campylobacter sp. MOP7]|uniref:AMIN domain-containing protein n=1 Tax=Campylobacter canis TaxID=3378588 RepID=UPI00387E30E0